MPNYISVAQKVGTSYFINKHHYIKKDLPKLFTMYLIQMFFKHVNIIKRIHAESTIKRCWFFNKISNIFIGIILIWFCCRFVRISFKYLLECIFFHLFFIYEQYCRGALRWSLNINTCTLQYGQVKVLPSIRVAQHFQHIYLWLQGGNRKY